MFKLLKKLFERYISAEVPPELVACEFECKVHECKYAKWLTCENRIRRMNQEIAIGQSNAAIGPAANQGN
jgi:hypothetical protein